MALLAVGTFNTKELFTIRFDPKQHTLDLVGTTKAIGGHSWLSTRRVAVQGDATHIYATCWTEPPSVAAYRILRSPQVSFELLNTAETASRSGYVTITSDPAHPHPVLYTVGGPTGEIIALDKETGGFDLQGRHHPMVIGRSGDKLGKGIVGRVQELDFVFGRCSEPGHTLAESQASSTDGQATQLDGSRGKNTMDFGGLRHGSHGVDLSPDGRVAFVPDIGRNCIWVYDVDPTTGALRLAHKCQAGRPNDGPRHTFCHPNGRIVYSLQEHSSYVDAYDLIQDAQGTRLEWREGVRIIPADESESLYWADEVRLSTESLTPAYLFASTRGLAKETKGWVAVFHLNPDGKFKTPDALCFWQTPTSGGWANAIEPAPQWMSGPEGDAETFQYAVLTDSEDGVVRMLRLVNPSSTSPNRSFAIEQVATLDLGNSPDGQLRQAATGVWI